MRFTRANRKHKVGLREENPDVGYVYIRGFCTEPASRFPKKEAMIFSCHTERDLSSSQPYFQCSWQWQTPSLPRASLHLNFSTYSHRNPLLSASLSGNQAKWRICNLPDQLVLQPVTSLSGAIMTEQRQQRTPNIQHFHQVSKELSDSHFSSLC